MRRNKKREWLGSQAREIAANVYKHMKYEAVHGVERLTDARWRTAKAVGVSESTITRILKEKDICDQTGARMRSPHRNKTPRKRTKRELDASDIGVLRRTIADFQRQYKKPPTLESLKKVLCETINYTGCKETLRQTLLDLGYEWKTMASNRRVLIEKHEYQMFRYNYLKQLLKYREEGRNIVFIGECYIHNRDMRNKPLVTLTEGTVSQSQNTISTGSRLIIVHAGGINGFVPNASLIYEKNSTIDQYNMTHHNYTRWFTTQLLPNIPERSVVVMDNASYNNTFTEVPTSNSSKSDMHDWLKRKNIDIDKNMKKIELYDIILKNKDYFANDDGDVKDFNNCHILKFPPQHPELNPLEKIWVVLKNYVANNNINKNDVDENDTSIIKIVNEGLNMIDVTTWTNTCRQVEETETMYWKNYENEKEFTIQAGETDSDSDDSSFDNND